MSNKMSIDEMVRQKIAQGEEPHNLGAWANMERMLDGKNPYQEEEKKDRRPWLFMVLGLIALSTAVVGGYNYFNSPNTKSNTEVVFANSPSVKTTNPSNQSQATKNSKASINVENETSSNLLASTTSKESTLESIRREERNTYLNNSNSIDNSPTNQKDANANRSNNSSNTSNFDSRQTSLDAQDKNPEKKEDILAVNEPDNRERNKAIQQVEKKRIEHIELSKKETTSVSPTITETYFDTVKVTEVSQKIAKDALGNKQTVADSFQYSIIEEKQRTVINPRYVELTKEQEEAAQRRTAIASNEPSIAVVNKPVIEDAAPTSVDNTKEITETTQSKERSSFFSLFKKAGAAIKQKSINMAHTRTPIYTGMFLGVNGALANAKHNFGGFQGGFTAMTPLSRLLTLQMEARLINQNNSGFTVTDNKQIVRSYFIDSTTLTHSKIYNYEMDSVSYGYNLKDFYTVQVPLLLNAHINKFNVYGGIHFNYGFRMNINTSTTSNPMTVADTSSLSSYVLRTDSRATYSREDFAHRLGLGYTVGAGYNFTNRINLDLRMSNLFWDNTTNAKREISNVFFKIPNFQLSLGYRFRQFEVEE